MSTSISDIDYNRGGYARFNLSREYVSAVHSRATDPSTGKVYHGEAGKQLQRRLLEKQAYLERKNK